MQRMAPTPASLLAPDWHEPTPAHVTEQLSPWHCTLFEQL